MNMKNLFLCAVATSLASGAGAQEMFDVPGNSVDRRFEIASMRYGEERVQMYSRLNDDDDSLLSIHVVSDVNCRDRTIRSLFQGNSAPESFPMISDAGTTRTIERGSDTERLARHACARQGFTLSGF